MRKSALAILLLITAGPAFSGGSVGGNPPLLLENTLELMRIVISNLPKAYAEPEDLRRASVRLGEAGAETTDLIVDGECIKVRKVRDRMVDDRISKEILPL